MNNLPIDLISMIINKIDIKDKLQFRATCKLGKQLIDDYLSIENLKYKRDMIKKLTIDTLQRVQCPLIHGSGFETEFSFDVMDHVYIHTSKWSDPNFTEEKAEYCFSGYYSSIASECIHIWINTDNIEDTDITFKRLAEWVPLRVQQARRLYVACENKALIRDEHFLLFQHVSFLFLRHVSISDQAISKFHNLLGIRILNEEYIDTPEMRGNSIVYLALKHKLFWMEWLDKCSKISSDPTLLQLANLELFVFSDYANMMKRFFAS